MHKTGLSSIYFNFVMVQLYTIQYFCISHLLVRVFLVELASRCMRTEVSAFT